MFKKCFILLMALWSCPFAFAVPHDPFQFYQDQEARDVTCEDKELANMPPARSQDSLPICFAMSSAVIAQFAICKKLPNRCDHGRPKTANDSISPLSMLSWTRTDDLYTGVNQLQNHKNLQFFAKLGGAKDALSHASSSYIFFSDACFPFDQLANKYMPDYMPNIKDMTDEEVEKTDKANQKLESQLKALILSIEKQYTKSVTEGKFCEECLAEINQAAQQLGVSSLSDIKDKMVKSKDAKKNSGQFLYSLVKDGCKDGVISLKLSQKPKFDSYPKVNEKGTKEDGSYAGLVGKIKDVLRVDAPPNEGDPLSFDGICLDTEGPPCKAGHSVAISGYRRVCPKSVGCESKTGCRELLKIQNSWGPESNGWVDAKTLLSYADKNKNNKDVKNVLAWYY